MRRLARLLRPCRSFQTIGSPSFDFRRFILHAEPLRIHGHCSASSLLWIHPTPRFAFASARSPKFLSELSTRVPRLYPVRSIRPMSFADARYWLHPIGETGQRIATFTRLRHTVHLRWNSCLRQTRLPHVSRLPHGLSSYSHFDIYMRLAPFGYQVLPSLSWRTRF